MTSSPLSHLSSNAPSLTRASLSRSLRPTISFFPQLAAHGFFLVSCQQPPSAITYSFIQLQVSGWQNWYSLYFCHVHFNKDYFPFSDNILASLVLSTWVVVPLLLPLSPLPISTFQPIVSPTPSTSPTPPATLAPLASPLPIEITQHESSSPLISSIQGSSLRQHSMVTRHQDGTCRPLILIVGTIRYPLSRALLTQLLYFIDMPTRYAKVVRIPEW